MTTARIATLVFLAFAWPGLAAGQQPPTQPKPPSAEPPPEHWYVEYSLSGGTITPRREIAVNQNATGDHERLFARLKSSLFVGGKVGVHGNRLGIEAGVFRTAEKIQVNNEFGVPFPNHGENITFVKADLLVYPFPRSAFDGAFRPYLSAGLGGNFFFYRHRQHQRPGKLRESNREHRRRREVQAGRQERQRRL